MAGSEAGKGPAAVGIFAKRPRPGEVKTRLAPALGAEGAAELARALLDDAVGRLGREGREGERGAGTRLELAFAPAGERAWFAERYPGLALRAQRGAGLAERLETWFREVLAAGAPAAVAVGSDSPWTDGARVAAALAHLEAGADLVLGPDLGGGYYLVAMGRPHPGLFTDITMSTGTMFDETLAWCAARGLVVELLPEDYDLDEPVDLERLARDLAAPDERRGDVDPADRPRAVEAVLAARAEHPADDPGEETSR